MLHKKNLLTLLSVFLFSSITTTFNCLSQTIDSSLLLKIWDANWISASGISSKDYGVFKFRKNFNLGSKPSSFIIHVSADNRYKLYVNGSLVSLGPARGDFFHWNFETVDIGNYLQAGKNTIAALVWNEGDWKPEAQISYETAFILQGNTEAQKVANSNSTWSCIKDSSYAPLQPHVNGYYAAGAGEIINMNQYVKDWTDNSFNGSKWMQAVNVTPGNPKGIFSYNYSWMLQPSAITQMEMKEQRIQQLRRAEGIKVPASFPASKTAVTVPAYTHATLLLDQTFLTNAYPTLKFSHGKNAGLSISYAEALYIKGNDKGNRNDVQGKMFIGKKDSIISNGTIGQEYTTLWWRTYRYIQVKVDTKEDSLVIEDIFGTATGYPLEMKAKFVGGNEKLQQILNIGWRTAKLCATETYMDCPYYEQLQYIGDTRIQALVTYYNSGDERLAKNALNLLDHSRMAEGITLSRYPTANAQEIPYFSLWYIGMLHDYWMYAADTNFIKEKLTGERQVLDFFGRYQQQNGSLKNVPYWTFSDWVNGFGWRDGIAPQGKQGNSSVADLQLLWAYQIAAEMEGKMGLQDYADKYKKAASTLKHTIKLKYWNADKLLFSDTPEKDSYSQHANALAILTGVVSAGNATQLAKKIITDSSLAPASIYFKYYLHQACIKAGLGNEYLNWLGKWDENIQLGLTTWAEMSDVKSSRSDCHAWGASPNIELYRTVLGIDSDAPGFNKVKIEPHLGTLENAGGEIPHPKGKIFVNYTKNGSKWNIEINLPESITGSFIWNGKNHVLHQGKNKFKM